MIFGFFAIKTKRHWASHTSQGNSGGGRQSNAFVGRAKQHIKLNARVNQCLGIKLTQSFEERAIIETTGIKKVRR